MYIRHCIIYLPLGVTQTFHFLISSSYQKIKSETFVTTRNNRLFFSYMPVLLYHDLKVPTSMSSLISLSSVQIFGFQSLRQCTFSFFFQISK